MQKRCTTPPPSPYHADLDADQLDAKLADVELIAAEVAVINNAQRAILDELARR